MKRTVAVFGLTLTLSFVGLYIVVGGDVVAADTYRLPPWQPGLALLCLSALLVQWFLPAVRLAALGRVQGYKIPYGAALLIHFVSVLSAAVTPSGSGGGPAIAAGFGRLGVPWGRSIGMAIQAFLLDLVFFAWVAPLGLFYLVASGVVALPPGVIILTVVSACLAIFASTVLGRYPRLAVRVFLWLAARPLLARFQPRLVATTRDYYRSARIFMRLPWSTWLSLQALGSLAWSSSFVLFWGLLRLYQPAEFLATVSVLSVTTLMSFIMPTPGASGFLEVAIGYGASRQVSSADLALPLLLWRLLTFHFIFVVGPVAGWLLFARGWRDPAPAVSRTEPDP